jgi:hypothetical protein
MQLLNAETRRNLDAKGFKPDVLQVTHHGASVFKEAFTLVCRHITGGTEATDSADKIARALGWCHKLWIDTKNENAYYLTAEAEHMVSIGYNRTKVVHYHASLLVATYMVNVLKRKNEMEIKS